MNKLNFLKKPEYLVLILSVAVAIAATIYSYQNEFIVAYGDAESHLNIAKRVVASPTPGLAQLGGIWLPLPHMLMIPFVYFDNLWRTGLAGSIISGLAFVISSLFLYKLGTLVTKSKLAGVFTALVFITNPNILYLQTTPMTELPLIAFFVLSSYFFIDFLLDQNKLNSLILAAVFGFCATLSRYDGWFLVLIEAGVLIILYFPYKRIPTTFSAIKRNWLSQNWNKLQGFLVLFSTLAFVGILLWLVWDLLILGDPLYFTHSQFSAKSQQQNWLARGELPAYNNLYQAIVYYLVTSMSNIGVLLFVLAIIGLGIYLMDKKSPHRFLIFIILSVPFVFNVVTLFLGQSVIFIPHLTPKTFEWNLFNVRYGVMMVPLAAIAIGIMFSRAKKQMQALIALALILQLGFYVVGYSQVISFADGVEGLSSATAKTPDAQHWINENYDYGYILVDDFARTLSIVRTNIPMQDVIYIGNKPYWEESLKEPEKYARWIIMHKDDDVWDNILADPVTEARLYTYFEKAYTSPEILVFKRNDKPKQN